MAADHFCLRWNNHQSTLVSVFDDLLESETLVDCTLAADGKYLKAHKVVLSACSPYLGMILSQHYDQHPIIILKDVKYEEMKAMLDYMYRGEVNISQELLSSFLKAAESLQIKGLTDTSSLNAEASKKQLQAEKSHSGDESTTSAPNNDDIPSREGSCSPIPKKRKYEINNKNSMQSVYSDNNRPVKPNVVSDHFIRNSVSPVSKVASSGVVGKKVFQVKSEPADESYDGDLPLDVDAQEESNKGISKPGPSNGSNNSALGSPWLMSVDSTGDEKQGSEQGSEEQDSEVWHDSLIPLISMSSPIPPQAKSPGKKYSCSLCGKIYALASSLYTHEKYQCGKEPQFKCPYCPHKTKLKGNLKAHIGFRHSDKPRPF
uniref:BTB domain-containing protein n=1 Tax=Clastoptera arizonana TaxID=38151 RepID=A0A1B6E3Z9_9HEMI